MSQTNKLFRRAQGPTKAMAQVYKNNYNNSVQHISELCRILKKDFPMLKDEDIKVHKFGGSRVKGITFVEAQLPDGVDSPGNYIIVSDIESIL